MKCCSLPTEVNRLASWSGGATGRINLWYLVCSGVIVNVSIEFHNPYIKDNLKMRMLSLMQFTIKCSKPCNRVVATNIKTCPD